MMTKGEFNYMSQVKQPDGSLLVTLTRHGDNHIYKLWVRDLYLPTELVIKEEITEVKSYED
jgi:hypothetical protein